MLNIAVLAIHGFLAFFWVPYVLLQKWWGEREELRAIGFVAGDIFNVVLFGILLQLTIFVVCKPEKGRLLVRRLASLVVLIAHFFFCANLFMD